MVSILHVLCYNLNLDLVSEYKEYWIKDLHLEVHDEQVLKEQESLTDKHECSSFITITAISRFTSNLMYPLF